MTLKKQYIQVADKKDYFLSCNFKWESQARQSLRLRTFLFGSVTACEKSTTTADFMINVAGEPRSPWNISAGCVFIDHFVQKMEYNDTQEMRKAIEKAFTNRIRSFRSRHKREVLSRTDRASERSKHSRQQHKYQVRL